MQSVPTKQSATPKSSWRKSLIDIGSPPGRPPRAYVVCDPTGLIPMPAHGNNRSKVWRFAVLLCWHDRCLASNGKAYHPYEPDVVGYDFGNRRHAYICAGAYGER